MVTASGLNCLLRVFTLSLILTVKEGSPFLFIFCSIWFNSKAFPEEKYNPAPFPIVSLIPPISLPDRGKDH